MNPLEAPPIMIQFAEDVNPRYLRILEGPPSDNYNMRQSQLALENLLLEQQDVIVDDAKIREAMDVWTSSDLSSAFSGIAHDSSFDNHPRFKGDISMINLKDVRYYVDYEKMPDE